MIYSDLSLVLSNLLLRLSGLIFFIPLFECVQVALETHEYGRTTFFICNSIRPSSDFGNEQNSYLTLSHHKFAAFKRVFHTHFHVFL